MSAVRDDKQMFDDADAVVFGLNDGSVDSHKNYCSQFNFNFPLLSDKDRKVAEKYGAKGPGYVKRTVVIVDKNGTIQYHKAGMPSNEEIVNCVKKLSSGK